MNTIHRIRKTFVRQETPSDCGLTCLIMIMNYTGRQNETHALRENNIIQNNGSSLLELRNLANSLNFSSRCVQMNLDFLRENTTPCILHLVNENNENHFQVCYGARKTRKGTEYLMADPARHVYYWREEQLDQHWVTKAALFFEELTYSSRSANKQSWRSLFSIRSFPLSLGISLILLNLFSALLGVAISWVLQRGINDSLAEKKQSLIIAVELLLLIIMISKSFFSFIRQRILINLNTTVGEKIAVHFVNNIFNGSNNKSDTNHHRSIKNGIAGIHKIQNAVSLFMATLLSDGSLALLVLGGIFYMMPLAAYINGLYLIVMVFLTIRRLPGISFDYAHLNEVAGVTENCMVKELSIKSETDPDELTRNREAYQVQNHNRYLRFAKSMAITMSKTTLLFECLGTIDIIVVFVSGLIKLQKQNMDYSTFMVIVILSYFITALMPKICNALYAITEGAEAAARYSL
jgi:ABC-type bacteriocin/lantibiotic exporter with double-glycine peptidase domain